MANIHVGEMGMQVFPRIDCETPPLSSYLANDLKSNPKLFVGDTSLFSIIHYVNLSKISLNEDLDEIKNCAYQWKMILNHDLSKRAQK